MSPNPASVPFSPIGNTPAARAAYNARDFATASASSVGSDPMAPAKSSAPSPNATQRRLARAIASACGNASGPSTST